MTGLAKSTLQCGHAKPFFDHAWDDQDIHRGIRQRYVLFKCGEGKRREYPDFFTRDTHSS